MPSTIDDKHGCRRITYQFITSTEQLLGFPDAQPVRVSFTSLLTKIKYTGANFLLEFNDFDHVVPERNLSYVTKIRCKNGEASRLAKMSVSLLCRYFDINPPNFDDEGGLTTKKAEEPEVFCIDDVYMKVLCFARCNGIYLSKNSKSSIFLDDITPISLEQSVKIAGEYYKRQRGSDGTFKSEESGTNSTSQNSKSILTILRNLSRLNNDPNSKFKFANLVNHSDSLTKLIVQLETEAMTDVPKRSITDLRHNPLFLPVVQLQTGYASNLKPRDSFASQNEFNSQLMSTQQPDYFMYPSSQMPQMGSEDDATPKNNIEAANTGSIQEATSLTPYTPRIERNKRRKLVSVVGDESLPDGCAEHIEDINSNNRVHTTWDPVTFSFGDVGTSFTIVGRVAAVSKLAGNSESKLYIISNDTFVDNKEDKMTLIPFLNCLEVIYTEPLPLMEGYQFEIVRSRWNFEGNPNFTNSSWRFYLKSFKTVNIEISGGKKEPMSVPNRQSSTYKGARKVDLESSAIPIAKEKEDDEEKSIILFQDLILDPRRPKYITMLGLFVSCSFEHPTYVTMVFTDFTKNCNLPQKYLFDRYILRSDIKLDLDSGYRVIMYNNFFQEFNRKITDLFRSINGTNGVLGVRELRDYNSENISQRGIVCKLGLKAQYFRGKLNLIVRECTPVIRGDEVSQRWSATNRGKLMNFYRNAAAYLNDNGLTSMYIVDNYSKFFPFTRSIKKGDAKIVLESDSLATTSNPESTDDSVYEGSEDEEGQGRGYVTDPQSLDCEESQPPSLNAGLSKFYVNDYDCSENISLLNFIKQIDNNLYTLRKVKLLHFEYYKGENVLEFYVTNVLNSNGPINPINILRIYIFGTKNLRYFLNKSEIPEEDGVNTFSPESVSALEFPEQEMSELVGKEFEFKLKRGSLRLSRDGKVPAIHLLIWCPIELTLEELQYQQRYLLPSDTIVKTEGG